MADEDSLSKTRPEELPVSTTPISTPVGKAEQSLGGRVVRHSVYYFDPVVFRVEGVLFKVPKYGFLVPGSMFYDMFSLPIPEGGEAQGSSDSNPIELPTGITQGEFFGFLFLLYPFFGQAYSEIHYEELVGALKLGTMWEFTKIRRLAVRLLSPLFQYRHPAETVLLAKRYHLKGVLKTGYVNLISGYNTIKSLRAPYQLDWETISRIFEIQAHSRAMYSESHSEPLADVDVIFSEEFEYIKTMDDDSEWPEIEVEGAHKEFQRHLEMLTKDAAGTTTRPNALRTSSQNAMSWTPAADQKHHIYYIDMISIPINNTVFRIPEKDFLPFYEYRSFTDKDGFASVKAICTLLHGVTEETFCRFLWTLYPINDLPLRFTYEEWLDVLWLSTMWGMKAIRQRAIKELTLLMTGRPHVETVLTARKYHVKDWIFNGLVGLVMQDPPFTIEGLRDLELDWETIAKLFSIRDRSFDYPPQRPKICCPWCSKHGHGPTMKKIHRPTSSCKYSCINMEYGVFDSEEENVSGLERLLNPETARALVEREFKNETLYW